MRLLRRPRAANRETERLATADSHRAAAAVRSRRRAHTPNRIRDNPLPVRAGAQDAVLFPCAQCRRVNAETRASSPTVSAGPCTSAGAMVDRVPSAVATSVRVFRSASSVTCALSIRR